MDAERKVAVATFLKAVDKEGSTKENNFINSKANCVCIFEMHSQERTWKQRLT
jgi:hypothetical protein